MNYSSKKILYIDLKNRSFDIKSFPELHEFIGGLPLALKIGEMYLEEKPLIFTIGPLNGYFPAVSNTCILNLCKPLESFYLGGSLSSRMQFSGFDAFVFVGQSEEPVFLGIDVQGVSFLESKEDFDHAALPGRSSKILFSEKVLLDEYFESSGGLLEKAFAKRLICGLAVNATNSFALKDISHYEKLYKELLDKCLKFPGLAEYGEFPSCVGCPLSCGESKVGEEGGNILVHTLVSCDHMKDIYSDLGIVFSCLNVLGYDYTHEDLEKIPLVVARLFDSLEKKL